MDFWYLDFLSVRREAKRKTIFCSDVKGDALKIIKNINLKGNIDIMGKKKQWQQYIFFQTSNKRGVVVF